MSKPILVPLDGSTLDERALDYARLIAGSAGAPLHLVRAVGAAAPAHYSRAETLSLAVAQQNDGCLDAQASLARTATRVRRLGHVVHTHVRFGRPLDVILATSHEHEVGLIVLATRGRRGLARWWEGSVADEVVRWADRPVLLVRESDNRLWSTDQPPRLLVAVDGSSFAEAVLEPASEMADVLNGNLARRG
jgi:nucleotide-binding universal stress UspA family protein